MSVKSLLSRVLCQQTTELRVGAKTDKVFVRAGTILSVALGERRAQERQRPFRQRLFSGRPRQSHRQQRGDAGRHVEGGAARVALQAGVEVFHRLGDIPSASVQSGTKAARLKETRR